MLRPLGNNKLRVTYADSGEEALESGKGVPIQQAPSCSHSHSTDQTLAVCSLMNCQGIHIPTYLSRN